MVTSTLPALLDPGHAAAAHRLGAALQEPASGTPCGPRCSAPRQCLRVAQARSRSGGFEPGLRREDVRACRPSRISTGAIIERGSTSRSPSQPSSARPAFNADFTTAKRIARHQRLTLPRPPSRATRRACRSRCRISTGQRRRTADRDRAAADEPFSRPRIVIDERSHHLLAATCRARWRGGARQST